MFRAKSFLNQPWSEEIQHSKYFLFLFKSLFYHCEKYKIHSACFSLFVNEIESSLNDSSVNGVIISANQMAQIWTMTHREAKRVIHLPYARNVSWNEYKEGKALLQINWTIWRINKIHLFESISEGEVNSKFANWIEQVQLDLRYDHRHPFENLAMPVSLQRYILVANLVCSDARCQFVNSLLSRIPFAS